MFQGLMRGIQNVKHSNTSLSTTKNAFKNMNNCSHQSIIKY